MSTFELTEFALDRRVSPSKEFGLRGKRNEFASLDDDGLSGDSSCAALGLKGLIGSVEEDVALSYYEFVSVEVACQCADNFMVLTCVSIVIAGASNRLLFAMGKAEVDNVVDLKRYYHVKKGNKKP